MRAWKLLKTARHGAVVRAIVIGVWLGPSDPATAEPAPFGYAQQSIAIGGVEHTVTVPEGFLLEVLVEDLGGPRLMVFAPGGELLIGSKSGRIYRLVPPYREPEVLITVNGYPHSVAVRDGELLIARTNGLYRAPYAPGQARVEPGSLRRLAELPGGYGHNSRTVAIGPDGRVYVSLGISGNCSNEYLAESYAPSDRRGGVMVLTQAGDRAVWKPFASGLRNPVGFDWHPSTGDLYASNNGPDHLGFELPPEYFSRLTAGSFHGMPWYQFDGRAVLRDRCIRARPPLAIDAVVPPAATFPARNAPMGVAFVREGSLDARWAGDAVVALRGSWATAPSGGSSGDPATRRPPKLVLVRFENGEARRVDDLVTGFQLPDGGRWARPVGVAVGPDGALYFTSDAGNNGLFRLRRPK